MVLSTIEKDFYFPLFASATYFSNAIVMDGVPGVGAMMSMRNP